MKFITQIVILTGFCLSLVNCSISEEIYIRTDGSIDYSYLLDASELMKMMPDSARKNNDLPKDSIISFADFINLNKDSIALSPEGQKKLEILKSLQVKMKSNDDEYSFTINGNFTNVQALNQAFSVINSLEQRNDKKETEFLTRNQYHWNGKVFRKEYTSAQTVKDISSLSNFFSGSNFKVTYHFPSKVKKVNNPKAILSVDRKTVVVEYNAIEYLTNPKIADIEIETK